MRFRILALLVFITLCSLPLLANAATYNWYFSSGAKGKAVGNDTTGNGSISNPWKTLSKAQKQIDTLGSGDTANLFFDRGDTWIVDTTTKKIYHFRVKNSGPIVNIDAYGSGSRPVFDGSVSDFSTADPPNLSTGPLSWVTIFRIDKTNCSMSNVEIKNTYGHGIYLDAGDGFTLRNSKIHNFGRSAIQNKYNYGIEDCVIEYNVIHTGEQLHRYGLRSGWGGAINLMASGYGNNSMTKNNIVRYNLVYDINGEGINAPNSVIEYNVVGDTTNTAIDLAPQDHDALTATVRYNFVIASDRASSDYGGATGIRIYDEKVGGDNSAAKISIYGNIIINRSSGIKLFCNEECNNPYGSVKIYNNTVIDSHGRNYRIANLEEVTSGYVYNNASIRYDRVGIPHTDNSSHANWTFSHNAFYPVNKSNRVGTGWTTNYITGNPKLPGEEIYSIDWDGLTGTNYFHMIDFAKHLYIPPDSSLANAGKTLGSGYNSLFLTGGTDFSKFKFQRLSQPESAKWCIGAIILDDDGKIDYLPPPRDLAITP